MQHDNQLQADAVNADQQQQLCFDAWILTGIHMLHAHPFLSPCLPSERCRLAGTHAVLAARSKDVDEVPAGNIHEKTHEYVQSLHMP